MGCSERRKEIKRRRHRKKKLTYFAKKAEKASTSEKGLLAEKIRALTPGGQEIVVRMGLEKG